MREVVKALPLFPLKAVLFPGQVLPLHIFEPRYRLMVNRCIEENLPFGVVLIREGSEVGSLAIPHMVGTTARIIEADRMEDGRLNIITIGESRFRILQLHLEEPYLTGDVVTWPWGVENHSLLSLSSPVRLVRQHLENYIAALMRFLGDFITFEDIPAHPVGLACLAAIALQVSPLEKQDLLVSPTIISLLEKEIALLQREARLLHITGGVPTRLAGEGDKILSDN